MTTYQHAAIQGQKIFDREAGSTTKLTIALLHGLPSSSYMFRKSIPQLASHFLPDEHSTFVAGKIVGFSRKGQKMEVGK
jgi:pimeloyl-ACP methyl ester carboxylesterase